MYQISFLYRRHAEAFKIVILNEVKDPCIFASFAEGKCILISL